MRSFLGKRLMYHLSTIQVASIERLAVRDGFPEPYHKVTFDLISEGIPTAQLSVWVHPAYPDEELVRVAQTFAWRRLLDLAEAAQAESFSEADIRSLWEQVKPAGF
jgi:hypothetical protein